MPGTLRRPIGALCGAPYRWVAVLVLATWLAAACSGGEQKATGVTAGPAAGATSSAKESARRGAQWPDWSRTDFSRTTIDLGEVVRGCPAKDCIPSLDAAGATTLPGVRRGEANFARVRDTEYPDNYPVALLRIGDTVRAYPLHILTWHEIVNDVVNGVPAVVTFCPLCNTALAFDRRVDGRTLDFGVSGNLRHSDLIMWDRQTESWWQQATGEGIVGQYSGTELKPLSLSVLSYADVRSRFPDADVLTTRTGFTREYGLNPYAGYDTLGSRPFLFDGRIDPRLDGLERVVALGRGQREFLAIPFSVLSKARVANVRVSGQAVAVFWAEGTASALGKDQIASAQDVGAAAAYAATIDGRPLSFTAPEPGRFRDGETGSSWDISGHAFHGPLAGRQLEPVIHTTEFWFAWAAFHPDTQIWKAD